MTHHRLLTVFAASSLLLISTATIASASSPDPNTIAPTVTTTPCGNNISAVNYIPAAGFDPNTATPAELAANDFPPKPADAASLSVWEHYVSNPIRRDSSCSDLSSDPASVVEPTSATPDAGVSPDTEMISHNYSGNVADDHSYTNVAAKWTVPMATSMAPEGLYSYSLDWVGLNFGLSNSQPLLQAGTESDEGYDGESHYGLFFEAYPDLSKQNVNTLDGPGDAVFVHVYCTSSIAYFHIDDETLGFNETYTWTHAIPSNPEAEWIMERPRENGGLPYLADAPMTFTEAEASGTDVSNSPVGQLPHYDFHMYTCDGEVQMAHPGDISSDGESFSEYFDSSGGGEHDVGCG